MWYRRHLIVCSLNRSLLDVLVHLFSHFSGNCDKIQSLSPLDQSVAMAVVCEACCYAAITDCITLRSTQLPDTCKQPLRCNSTAIHMECNANTSNVSYIFFVLYVCLKEPVNAQQIGWPIFPNIDSKSTSHLLADQYILSMNMITCWRCHSSLRGIHTWPRACCFSPRILREGTFVQEGHLKFFFQFQLVIQFRNHCSVCKCHCNLFVFSSSRLIFVHS